MIHEGNEAEAAANTYRITHDATVSMRFANIVALLLLVAVYLLFILPFPALWGRPILPQVTELTGTALLRLTLLFFFSIAAHEAIHAAAFVLFGKVPPAAIRFGFSWRAAAPYAHCRIPVTARGYRLAVALPGFVLGMGPGLAGLLTGTGWLAIWGAFMTAAAGGDLAVLWAVRTVPKGALVLDHPSEPGCLVLAEEGASP